MKKIYFKNAALFMLAVFFVATIGAGIVSAKTEPYGKIQPLKKAFEDKSGRKYVYVKWYSNVPVVLTGKPYLGGKSFYKKTFSSGNYHVKVKVGDRSGYIFEIVQKNGKHKKLDWEFKRK